MAFSRLLSASQSSGLSSLSSLHSTLNSPGSPRVSRCSRIYSRLGIGLSYFAASREAWGSSILVFFDIDFLGVNNTVLFIVRVYTQAPETCAYIRRALSGCNQAVH